MKSKWFGPIQGPGLPGQRPIIWRALLFRFVAFISLFVLCMVLWDYGQYLYLFEKREPEDWQQRSIAGLQILTPAPLIRMESPYAASRPETRRIEEEEFSDYREAFLVTAKHFHLDHSNRSPKERLTSMQKVIQKAQEKFCKDVVCYQEEMTISGMPAMRVRCTGESGRGFRRVEALLIANANELWWVDVRYTCSLNPRKEKAAKRILDSVTLAAK